MLRVTVQAVLELILTLVLAFVGLVSLVGTLDEYRSGKAFNEAMDSYAAGERAEVLDHLDRAIAAKDDYSAPKEALGKLYIDQGADERNPKKFADARQLFTELRRAQEAKGEQPSQPVLIGEAVAELEAVRARNPGIEELRRAVTEARVALDKALDAHPDSGDLHVNLATLALMANDVPRAKQHIRKVDQVGNISIDALPYLYNLKGLVALEEGDFEQAVAEFEKTKEFKPSWSVPQLNVAAAYAQSLFRGGLDERTAQQYSRSIASIINPLKRDKHPLLPVLYHAQALYRMRKGDVQGALNELREAEKYGQLTWHGRFNRGVAQYLAATGARTDERQRKALFEETRPTFERALRSQRATPRDLFVAAAALGKMAALEEDHETAIRYFERAVAIEDKGKDPFIPKARAIVYRSLGAVCYNAGQYEKAKGYLAKAKGVPDPNEAAAHLIERLTTKPVVRAYTAKMGKVVTDYDVRLAATLAAEATPDPITADNVRLTLVNTTNGTSQPIPFELAGQQLHALLVNVPQGAMRIECQITDSAGNQSEIAIKTLRIDREPPRIDQREPAPGASVKALKSVGLHVFDVLGSVDFETLTIVLKYPHDAKTATRFLVSRGKYMYDAADGPIRKGGSAGEQIKAPVPDDATPGTYLVIVRVRDLQGRLNENEWSFILQ